MSKYTPWFPASIKPVRVGWYSTESKAPARRYWNGWAWSGMCDDRDDDAACAKWQHWASTRTDIKWRGLTAPHPDYKQGNTK